MKKISGFRLDTTSCPPSNPRKAQPFRRIECKFMEFHGQQDGTTATRVLSLVRGLSFHFASPRPLWAPKRQANVPRQSAVQVRSMPARSLLSNVSVGHHALPCPALPCPALPCPALPQHDDPDLNIEIHRTSLRWLGNYQTDSMLATTHCAVLPVLEHMTMTASARLLQTASIQTCTRKCRLGTFRSPA